MPKPQTDAEQWNKIVQFFKDNLTHGEAPELDTILFLIGVQELGIGNKKFKKDDKVNLMHIAVCRLLEPYGYYRFTGKDPDGWPHFEIIEQLPELKANEQTILMKKAIIQYFKDQNIIAELQ